MAVKELLKAAKEKENNVVVKYTPIDVEMVAAEYWERWCRLVKELTLKPYKPK
ncbi:MAG: hypothetical protein ACKD6N_07465 [Candidatus Bathyarchaeota archaeon]